MARRIFILSGIQISTNPRVVKEADVLGAAGYDVTVLGATLNPALADRDRELVAGKPWEYVALLDAESREFGKRIQWFLARLRLRAWVGMRRKLKVAGFRQLGYAGPEMLSYCLKNPADLYIAHNPQSMWIARELISKNKRVAADMEDWYSEDLLPNAQASVPVDLVREAERDVLRGAAFITTTSRVLSEALSAAYGCQKPVVVYNSFPRAERDAIDGQSRDRQNKRLPSLIWFSQVIAGGRGLETLMDSLQHVGTPFEIHLRGNYDKAYSEFLLSRAPAEWRGRMFFHEQIPHSRLLSRIAEHTIGFAGDMAVSRSRDLTITNKVFQYLLAGLPIIASDTRGHREVASIATDAVSLFVAGDAESLARALDSALSNAAWLHTAGQSAVKASQDKFSWEESAQRLVGAVAKSVGA